MSNLLKRLLLAVIALPIIYAAIFLLPQRNHLTFVALLSLLSGTGAFEISRLFIRPRSRVKEIASFVCGFALPAAVYLQLTGVLPVYSLPFLLFALLALPVTASALPHRGSDFNKIIDSLTKTLLYLLYPGFFLSFLVAIAFLSFPSLSLALFLSLVFANDSLAYIFGMLFGSNNRGIFAASPNKSAAGLAGGIAGAIATSALFYLFTPELFQQSWMAALVLGLLISCAATVGDLFESVLKRSVAVKDSGTLMGGRGGVMDVLDSICFSAPFFWFFFKILATL